jgi:hypothetical protein
VGVLELHDDMVSRTTEDLDLRDDRATRRRWWFGVIVALDILAMVGFLALVATSRFT